MAKAARITAATGAVHAWPKKKRSVTMSLFLSAKPNRKKNTAARNNQTSNFAKASMTTDLHPQIAKKSGTW
jgi:hypothetical protein